MMQCKKCGFDLLGSDWPIEQRPKTVIVKRFLNRGREQMFFRCSCGGVSTFFNKEEQTFFYEDDIEDLRCADCHGHGCSSCSKKCEVEFCQTPFDCVEQHHTFPIEIYGKKEADRWPIVSLCLSHHMWWHKHLLANRYIIEELIETPSEYRVT